MKIDKRFWIYTVLSIMSFVLSGYAAHLGFQSLAVRSSASELVAFLVVALIFVAVGAGHLYFALSFKFGIVEQVFGAKNSATLVLSGNDISARHHRG
jgi:hypothetical protein